SLEGVSEGVRAQGVRLEYMDQPVTLPLEEFRIESSQLAAQTFERHQERTVTGKYEPIELKIPEGTYRVSMKQPLARLAFYLIEPRSNDGFLTWNFLDEALKNSKTYPITRTRD